MDKAEIEEIALALISAYVWVASSDEGVDLDEYNKFQHVILESPFATQFNIEDLRHTFKDMVGVFQTDYEYGIQITRNRIKRFNTTPMVAEEIVRLSRAAAIADSKLKPPEEKVIIEIAKELEIRSEP